MAKSIFRGNASQFFVAGELCRRGYSAVVTLGNTPNTDILCTNQAGTRFVHVQVKTFLPGNKTCSVGSKAERDFGPNFFWVLGGIPDPEHDKEFEYFVIPSKEMSKNIREGHQKWLQTPGKNARPHAETSMRVVFMPPHGQLPGRWDVSAYKNAWHMIEEKLQ
ncbi:MAG: hypothetical protein ACRDBL_04105 [Rhabdaerophilum sp.]